MPLSTRLRKLVEAIINFRRVVTKKEAQRNHGAQNPQVAASCESIVDTTMQGADFGANAELARGGMFYNSRSTAPGPENFP
jgi:hypothetical protein